LWSISACKKFENFKLVKERKGLTPVRHSIFLHAACKESWNLL
jgi:hypothetical protein